LESAIPYFSNNAFGVDPNPETVPETESATVRKKMTIVEGKYQRVVGSRGGMKKKRGSYPERRFVQFNRE
jgi:hypothetical protein